MLINEFKKKYKKALVTGGAGFIGSHIVDFLVKNGVDTISIDNYIAGKKSNLQHLSSFSNLQEIECDVRDTDILPNILNGVDVVFNQAASKKNICMSDPKKDLDINGLGTLNLLQLSMEKGVKKFVHASTGSVYGEAQYIPQDENHPLCPNSYYGVSKLAGEKYVKLFNSLHGMDTTVLRYFHVYGPRQDSGEFGGVVAIFIQNALEGKDLTIFGDGLQERSFTYVKDVVSANICSAVNPDSKGKVFNCASGITVTVRELADKVIEKINNSTSIKYNDWVPGDIKKFYVSNKIIKSVLGIDFETNFDRGLGETIEFQKGNPL